MVKASIATSVGGNSSYQNFVSLVSVYSHERGWVVRHKVMENQERSEIEIVESLINELSGTQVIITASALHCQKKTLQLIIDGGNDYIVTIKQNQSSLFKAAQELVRSTRAIDTVQTKESLHGRTTTRTSAIYAVPAQLLPTWAGAKRIIAIVRTGSRWLGKKSRRRLVDFHETHYYLSSKDWSATQFSDAIRGHWLIENRLHWVKDVTLNEDNCINRGGNAPANWAMVRQFLVSIARMIGTKTLPQALRFMANQLENVSELLFGLDRRSKPVKFGARSSANSPSI